VGQAERTSFQEEFRKLRRRERSKIFYDILCSIIEQETETRAKITRVQNDVNLPSDRLRLHLREMNSLGLLDYGEFLVSTEKGRAFVAEFRKVVEILRQFGL
jgi:predicted transcriptional regulator